jgi:predicted dehydrogenase
MQSLLRTAGLTFQCLICLTLTFPGNSFPQADSSRPLRLGIIGLDTSHVIEFTKLFNDPANPEHVPGATIVAAYKGGSPDIKDSWGRVEGYTNELRDKWKIQIVDDIPSLCKLVDGVLIESLDGRKHLEQVKPVLAARKPVFIDKPLAANYHDAKEIVRLVKEAGVPWFSASSLRWWEETQRLKNAPETGGIIGCDAYGPCELEPHHTDLAWYGIHTVEIVYALMGTGCESVNRVHTDGMDVVVGTWKDGRVATVRGMRKGPYAFGVTVFGNKAILKSEDKKFEYRPMLVEMVKFFQTGVSPVNPDETLEMFAFMQAADLSKARGGASVLLSEVTK